MNTVLEIAKSLSDEGRLRILVALREHGELCGCQLAYLLGLAPATISRHVTVLRHAGLVESRKQGRWVYCSLRPQPAGAPAEEVLAWVFKTLAQDPKVQKDRVTLGKILSCSPEELCRQLCQ